MEYVIGLIIILVFLGAMLVSIKKDKEGSTVSSSIQTSSRVASSVGGSSASTSATSTTDEEQSYGWQAVTYLQQGDYDAAIRSCDQAIRINKNSDGAYYVRGMAYGKKKEYDQALRDFTRTLDIDSTFGNAYLGRAQVYIEQEQDDHALEELNQGIQFLPSPDSVHSAHYLRGDIYRRKDQIASAIVDYTRAIDIALQFANTQFAADQETIAAYFSARGIAYTRDGQITKAIDDFRIAIDLTPDKLEKEMLLVQLTQLYRKLESA
jgi:tetratricopeptide (TPR) repeat protein